MLINYLQLPLALALLACLLVGAAFVLRRRPRANSWLASPALLLLVVVLEGYLALSSTVNQGTAFALPWIPALIVLVLAAAATVPVRPLRLGLAALLVAACAISLLVKNGVSDGLSRPRTADLPLIGVVTVVDGRDVIYASLDARGYPVDPPPARLPELHEEWTTLNEQLG